MTAILRRELSAYFTSPIVYVYLAVFYVFSGFYFVNITLAGNTTNLTPVFSQLFSIVLFMIPILTMRLLSEDKRNKTDQALLTAPVSLTGLVLGKFFAAVVVYVLGLASTLLYTVIIAFFAPPSYPTIFGNFTALLLLGCALIAIGMLLSAMTENQVIAAVGGFAVGLFVMMMDSISSLINNPLITTVIEALSFGKRYIQFVYGIFDLSGVLFFLSVCAAFLFLTVRVLEKRRWS